MNSEDQQILSNYLAGGGNLYIEGVDVADDHSTYPAFFSLFGATYPGNAPGIGAVTGVTGTPTEGMNFNYVTAQDANQDADQITAGAGVEIFRSGTAQTIGRAVAYDNGTYRTIMTSALLGGMIEGTGINTRAQLLSQYITYLVGGNQPVIWASDSEIDFGYTGTDQTLTHSLTIGNAGSVDLEVTDIVVTGPEFTAGDNAPYTIAQGEQVSFDVTFTSPEFGECTGSLAIHSNDPENPVLTIPLSAICAQPPAAAVSLDFINIAMDADTVDDSNVLTLSNSGGYDLEFTSEMDLPVGNRPDFPAWFDMNPAEGTIPAGESLDLVLTFDSSEGGGVSGVLFILTNDPDHPEIGVDVVMNTPDVPWFTVESWVSLPEGATAEGARVHFYQPDVPPEEQIFTTYIMRTDHLGQAVIPYIIEGTYDVIVSKDGYTSIHQEDILIDGDTTLNFQFGAQDAPEDTPPHQTALSGNYPNPFNPETTIRFELAQKGQVVIDVYNILGQRVITLVDGVRDAGRHEVVWTGRDENGIPAASGMYLYRMKNGTFTGTGKMILLK